MSPAAPVALHEAGNKKLSSNPSIAPFRDESHECPIYGNRWDNILTICKCTELWLPSPPIPPLKRGDTLPSLVEWCTAITLGFLPHFYLQSLPLATWLCRTHRVLCQHCLPCLYCDTGWQWSSGLENLWRSQCLPLALDSGKHSSEAAEKWVMWFGSPSCLWLFPYKAKQAKLEGYIS